MGSGCSAPAETAIDAPIKRGAGESDSADGHEFEKKHSEVIDLTEKRSTADSGAEVSKRGSSVKYTEFEKDVGGGESAKKDAASKSGPAESDSTPAGNDAAAAADTKSNEKPAAASRGSSTRPYRVADDLEGAHVEVQMTQLYDQHEAEAEKAVEVTTKLSNGVEVAATVIEVAQAVLEPLSEVLGVIGDGLSIISGLLDCIVRIAENNAMCVEVRKRAIALYDIAQGTNFVATLYVVWLSLCVCFVCVASPCKSRQVYERYIGVLTEAVELTAKFWNNRNSQFAFLLNWILSKKYQEDFAELMSNMDSVRNSWLRFTCL